MELKDLINKMGVHECKLDATEISIKDVLNEGKYNKLLSYLLDNKIQTTNDLKRMDISDYNKLKMGIPDLEQVGEEKTNAFILKLDMIRKNENGTYIVNQTNIKNENVLVKPVGKLQSTKNWFIEINLIKYDNNNEYLDIRQVKNDGTRGKGISIKKELISDFKKIITTVPDEIVLMNNHETACNNNEQMKSNDLLITPDVNEVLESKNEKANEISFDDFEDLMTHSNLKELILDNEKELFKKFSNILGHKINLFIKKIEALKNDGDIVKFLNNTSILDIKKEQYDLIHENGMKTAIDIMEEYDKSGLKYTRIDELSIGDKINTMTSLV